MKKLTTYIKSATSRTQKAQLNVVAGLIIKGAGILISLLLVPLTIDYLSKETYGTWLTISSIISMLGFLDIGIGNGLRNKFSEAVANNNSVLARAYASTAYMVFFIVQMVFVLVFLLIFPHIPWQKIIHTKVSIDRLEITIMVTVVAVAIKLVLDILTYILLALQQSGWTGLINLLSNTLILICTYVLSLHTKGNLVLIAVVTVCSPILVLLISGFLLYRKRLSEYKPSFRFVDFKYASNLLSLGYKFFFIQIAAIILFYTDSLIINQLFGSTEVTVYNVSFRYFNAINAIFAIAITPYWSAFTEAATKNDQRWMLDSYAYLQKLWLVLVLIITVMVLFSPVVYRLWVGSRVVIPVSLSVSMGVFVLVSCWNSITTVVINGLGKIRLQLYFSLFAALINIPLSVLLGQRFHLGSTGVVLATVFSLLTFSLVGAVQAKKLISSTAKGIWNQ